MPAIMFKDHEARLASFDVLDELDVPVHVVRNPDPNDKRPIHIILARAWPRFVQLCDQFGVAYEIVDYGSIPAPTPVESGG